jgi:hypothetical protein
MASTLISSKSNSEKSPNNDTTANMNSNETPITEEELKKKETPITINEVLRLKKTTNSKILIKNNLLKKFTLFIFKVI